MTTKRAVAYGGLSCLLAAWLASAASTTFQQAEPARDPDRAAAMPSTEMLASEVQAHAAKLRQRLAAAPTRPLPQRNPFFFDLRAARTLDPPRPIAPEVVAHAPVAEPISFPEPALTLIGVAEDRGPKGAEGGEGLAGLAGLAATTRTAIIADDTEALFMVTVGETVLGRYRVEAIGAEAVALKDINTNAIRRLGLK